MTILDLIAQYDAPGQPTRAAARGAFVRSFINTVSPTAGQTLSTALPGPTVGCYRVWDLLVGAWATGFNGDIIRLQYQFGGTTVPASGPTIDIFTLLLQAADVRQYPLIGGRNIATRDASVANDWYVDGVEPQIVSWQDVLFLTVFNNAAVGDNFV